MTYEEWLKIPKLIWIDRKCESCETRAVMANGKRKELCPKCYYLYCYVKAYKAYK